MTTATARTPSFDLPLFDISPDALGLLLGGLIQKAERWAARSHWFTPPSPTRDRAYLQWFAGNVQLWLRTRRPWQFLRVSQILKWEAVPDKFVLDATLYVRQSGVIEIFRATGNVAASPGFGGECIEIMPANRRSVFDGSTPCGWAMDGSCELVPEGWSYGNHRDAYL